MEMLILSRKAGEKLVIGNDVIVEVVRVRGNRVTLGLTAPAEIAIMRSELTAGAADRIIEIELGEETDQFVAPTASGNPRSVSPRDMLVAG
jgi:carbon storage regulator